MTVPVKRGHPGPLMLTLPILLFHSFRWQQYPMLLGIVEPMALSLVTGLRSSNQQLGQSNPRDRMGYVTAVGVPYQLKLGILVPVVKEEGLEEIAVKVSISRWWRGDFNSVTLITLS